MRKFGRVKEGAIKGSSQAAECRIRSKFIRIDSLNYVILNILNYFGCIVDE